MKQPVPVKVGIIGTGQRAVAFARCLDRLDTAELVALCDVNEDRLTHFATHYPHDCAVTTTDLKEFLAVPGLDAVMIAVPDRFHRTVAEAAFAAGKHCLVEKPLALTVEDCRAIILAKQQASRILQVGFVLRCAPFYQRVKQVVDSGVLGQIMSVEAGEYLSVEHMASYMRRWHRKKQNSGSFLLAKCSHDLDLLSWLVGSRPARVASFGGNNFFLPRKQPATHCSICPEMESCAYRFRRKGSGFVMMTEREAAAPAAYDFDRCVYTDDKDIVDNQLSILEYANGVRASFSLQGFYAGGSDRMIRIAGTAGYLAGAMRERVIHLHFSSTGQSEVIDLRADVPDGDGHGGGDLRFVREFIDCIRTGTEPLTDLQAGLASTVVANAIDAALTAGRVVSIEPAAYRV